MAGFLISPVLLAGISALMLSLNVFVLYNSPAVKPAVYYVEQVNKSESKGESQNQTEVAFPIIIPDDTVMAGTEDMGEENNNNNNTSVHSQLIFEMTIHIYIYSGVRYLTIGISSVWRNETYIIKTINSIINESTSEQREKEMFLFLLLADEDSEIRAARAANLSEMYSAELDSGFMRILQPPDFLYPQINFTTIRRTYGDPPARVKWRTKQVLDFTFLFWYTWTRQPSEYYLILEDDVMCAKNYLQAIKDFVYEHRVYRWVTLQFAHFMGIGRLLRVSDLERLVPFLLLFYREHPWDILLSFWSNHLMVPEPPPKHLKNLRNHGIFQHIGTNSTLSLKNKDGKKTPIDKSFVYKILERKIPPLQPQRIAQYKNKILGPH